MCFCMGNLEMIIKLRDKQFSNRNTSVGVWACIDPGGPGSHVHHFPQLSAVCRWPARWQLQTSQGDETAQTSPGSPSVRLVQVDEGQVRRPPSVLELPVGQPRLRIISSESDPERS